MRELVGGKPTWVRAVDGVAFEIRKGEVFCLVGESGCGKTTTGKAILKLVDATEGDIFIEMADEETRTYDDARRRPEDPATKRTIDGLRRKYSITWKETLRWTPSQILFLAGAIGVAFFLAFFLPALVMGLLSDPFTDSRATIGFCLATGLILGLVGTLPPTRPTRRTPVLLTLIAILTIIFGSIPTFYVHRAALTDLTPFDAGASLAAPWGQDIFGMLVGVPFGAIAAGGVSAVRIDSRQRSEGLAGIRMRTLRKRLQLIFQDPYESLNPKQSVYEIVSEPLLVNRIVTSPEETSALVTDALSDVGLRPPDEFMFRFPHELSGGQRQRVSIAAALVLQPDFIVADEPVSMLDVSIRTEILQLMMDLRKSRGITYLFITHDLSLAWVLADRIAVMYLGKIVEIGSTAQVIGRPMHPYTKALISVVPSPDPRHKVERIILKGERPDPVDIPAGCRFHPRCPFAFEKCGWNAKEVADELESLKASGVLAGAETIEALGLDLVRVSPAGVTPDALAENLGVLVSGHRDVRLPLKGIADIRSNNGLVDVALRGWSEPELVEIEPGNAVACHLVTPPAEVPEAVKA